MAGRIRFGLSVNDLCSRSVGEELLILRPANEKWNGAKAANYLLVMYASGHVPYGFERLFKHLTKPKTDTIPNGLICSELVLESLVFGAQLMVEEYASLADEIFLPANFSTSKKFNQIIPDYLEVT